MKWGWINEQYHMYKGSFNFHSCPWRRDSDCIYLSTLSHYKTRQNIWHKSSQDIVHREHGTAILEKRKEQGEPSKFFFLQKVSRPQPRDGKLKQKPVVLPCEGGDGLSSGRTKQSRGDCRQRQRLRDRQNLAQCSYAHVCEKVLRLWRKTRRKSR